jgi:hypothetical protein
MIVKEINTNVLVAPKHEVIFTEFSDIGYVLGEVVMTIDGHEISGYGTRSAVILTAYSFAWTA